MKIKIYKFKNNIMFFIFINFNFLLIKKTKNMKNNFIKSKFYNLFNYNYKYEVIAFTDGSFNKNTNQFSYGLVFLNNGKKNIFYEKFNDKNWAKLRNVAGEIMGAQKAMQLALEKKLKSILIYHDFIGISKWCTGEWKTTKLETNSYKLFYDEISKYVNIKFRWIKSHSGNLYNNEANYLALKAFDLVKISKPLILKFQ